MNESEFVASLVSKCDFIKPLWDEHLEFWEGDEPGYYNDISVTVHYVINQYQNNATGDFKEIFDYVELGANSKMDSVSELALVGFVEGVLMVGSHSNLKPENFSEWLGEKSYQQIIELNKLFSGKST